MTGMWDLFYSTETVVAGWPA